MLKLIRGCFLCGVLFVWLAGCGGSPAENSEPILDPASDAPPRLEPVGPGSLREPDTAAPAMNLGLKVLYEVPPDAGETQIPDLASEGEAAELNDFSREQNEISVHSKLFLRDPLSLQPNHRRNLFLVWPENSLGSPIRSAFYSHRVQLSGEDDPGAGNLQSRPVWHDVDRHLWFIPLAELFHGREGYQETDVKLEDIQRVVIEFSLERGPNVFVQLRFQVSGPLISPEVQSVTVPAPTGAASSWIQRVAREGMIIKKERITNSQNRPYALWLRAEVNEAGLGFATFLRESSFVARSASAPSGPHWSPLRSGSHFHLDQVSMRHISGVTLPGAPVPAETAETRNLVAGQWEKIVLQPRETIELEWKARPRAESVNCVVPVSQPIQFTWQTPPIQTYHWEPVFEHWDALLRMEATSDPWRDLPGRYYNIIGGGMMRRIRPGEDRDTYMAQYSRKVPNPLGPPSFHTETKVREWQLVGGQLQGNQPRELRITHSFTSTEEATRTVPEEEGAVSRGIHFLTLKRDSISEQIRHGEISAGAAPFTCQGVFR